MCEHDGRFALTDKGAALRSDAPGAGAGRHPHVQVAAGYRPRPAGRTPTLTELADYQNGHVHGQVAKAVAEDLAGGGIDC
ncbi:hypothetical protein [Salinispora arenicola]|uniref:hypothetical protein n=1 Tax=Salinispora arenicola TaxID=168697 RepID=UPI00037FA945|nr:hypothetical protein [Salinispora arenicola]